MLRWLPLFLALPMAGAQWTYDVALTAEGPDLVQVDAEAGYDITWTVTCRMAPSAASPPMSTWVVQLGVEAPAGIMVSGALAHQMTGPDCVTTPSQTGDTQWRVMATRDAAGLVVTDVPISISVGWGGGGAPGGSVDGSGTLRVVPDYMGRVEARVPKTIAQGEPGTVTRYEVVVTNHGNAATVLDITTDGKGIDVPATWPAEGLAAGETRSLWLNYTHPEKAGWNNDQTALGLKLVPRSADDPDKAGDPVQVNLLARTRGMPAPALPLVLLGLALVARRP